MPSTEKTKATREDVEREASRYILHELGDRLWAGDPVYDKTSNLWSVPVHSLSLPEEVELGQITVDDQGRVAKAPTRRAIQSAFEKQRGETNLQPLHTVEHRQSTSGTESVQGNLVLMLLPSLLEETDLVARVAAGNKRAEEELFLKYRRGVAIVLNHATNNDPAAADLCQETFSITFQKIRRGELREPRKLPAFIWTVARNLVTGHFRKLRTPQTSNLEEAEDVADSSLDQLDIMVEKEKAALVRRVLGYMESERERQALYRFYIAEENKEQICSGLGITARQFDLILFRARKHFRKLYEKMVSSK